MWESAQVNFGMGENAEVAAPIHCGMTSPDIDLRKAGMDVLCLVEEMGRAGATAVTAEEVFQFRPLPGLSAQDLDSVLKFLGGFGYLRFSGAGVLTDSGFVGVGGWVLTPTGRSKAWHLRSTGKTHLDFPDPDGTAPQINIGQGATGPIQAPVHTGSGDIHATQHNTVDAHQQAQILDLLSRLQDTLTRLPTSADRDVAQTLLRTATDAAQQGAWEVFKGRMSGLLHILVLLSSLAADGPAALAIGRQIMRALGGS